LSKAARVITNDPENEEIRLTISGRVEKFASIQPRRVNLRGAVDEEITRTVSIVPETEDGFKIIKVTALEGSEIAYDLKSVEVSGKSAYELTITNKKDVPGRYYERLVLLTDQSDHEPLTVIVTGHIYAAEASPI